jgi:hypothetical protein
MINSMPIAAAAAFKSAEEGGVDERVKIMQCECAEWNSMNGMELSEGIE